MNTFAKLLSMTNWQLFVINSLATSGLRAPDVVRMQNMMLSHFILLKIETLAIVLIKS